MAASISFVLGINVIRLFTFVLLVSLAVGVAIAQSSGPQAPAPNSSATVVNPDAQTQLLRILTPAAGQQLDTNYVQVSYELMNPGMAGGEPNFLLQLDDRDPITTRETTYNFTGLTPGQHSLTVQMVDANGTPVTGGRTSVVFFVASPASSQPAPRTNVEEGGEQPKLAAASSPLPLLSVVGFGALLGGVISALRARR